MKTVAARWLSGGDFSVRPVVRSKERKKPWHPTGQQAHPGFDIRDTQRSGQGRTSQRAAELTGPGMAYSQ